MDAQAEITRDVRIEAARLKLELDKNRQFRGRIQFNDGGRGSSAQQSLNRK